MWPEGDVFGSADVEPDEELELLKQILHANLPSEWFHIQTFFVIIVVLLIFHHSNAVNLRDNSC